MAAGRPKKLTVSFFPHFCTQKQTLFIVQQKFGNDGYAFWFKLLEQLGVSNNHYIDLKENGTEEYFFAYTGVNNQRGNDILDLLAKLHAIDEDLWAVRVIWSQNFVDGLTELYNRRQTDLPARPTHLLTKKGGKNV